MSSLASALARGLGVEEAAWSEGARASLELELAERLEVAEEYWNHLQIPRADVLAYLARRMDLDASEAAAPEQVTLGLGNLAVTDLFLCCALVAGHAQAFVEFERAFGSEIEKAVKRLDIAGDLSDEVRQVLRDKLFVAEAGAAKGIERYLGRGPLGRWLWVIATREALIWRRRHRREEPLLDSHLGIAAGDVELDYLKREYRAEFRIAFAEAMQVLTSKERNLLHYHFVRRLTIDQIGTIYRVHRVTAFRWLRKARLALLAATKAQLASRLEISASDVDSIIRLVQSRLEVSVERVLGAPPEGRIEE